MSRPSQPQAEIILCVPGKWPDRTDLVTSIAKKSEGYLFAGMVILQTATGESAKLEVCGRDPKMRKAFAAAGRHWATKGDLDEIDGHSFVLYLLKEGGSAERVRCAMDFATGLLTAGGLAVKVETAGVAHSPADWIRMARHKTFLDLMRAFVVVVTGDETDYSCGMHNFGLRDVVLTSKLPRNEAAHLVNHFALYALSEAPTLKDGETFSLAEDAPRYRLRAEACTAFAPDDTFHNPYGMWRLSPVAGRPTRKEG